MANKREQDNGHETIETRMISSGPISKRYHGGTRRRFRVFTAAGDKQGNIGFAGGKAQEMTSARQKSASKSKVSMVPVTLKGNTIPHAIEVKYKATRVLLKPAAPGTGIVAGSVVKSIVELAGVKDLLSKVHGSTNPVNVAYATIKALSQLRKTKNDK